MKNMGSTTIINATILPEKTWKWQRLEGKHTALQITLNAIFDTAYVKQKLPSC
jgi:hypothetical protein